MAHRCLFALKAHAIYARIMALRVALNAILCFLLVPLLSARGVALAFALSFMAGAFLSRRAVHAITDSPPGGQSGRWVAQGIAAMIAVAAGHGLTGAIVEGTLFRVTFSGLAAAVAVMLVYGVAYAWDRRARHSGTGVKT